MRKINGLYLLAILGLLTVIAFGITMNDNTNDSMVIPLVVSIFILFFIGLYGIAFTVRKVK